MSNVPAISIESALPTAQSTSSMKSPREIFTAAPKDFIAKNELDPREKRTLRNRLKNTRRRRNKGTQGELKKPLKGKKDVTVHKSTKRVKKV